MKPQYLRVRNWEKFQHYKNRRPPWVRYHVETLDDYELLSLPYATQLVYDRLLLLAARTDNNIPHDPLRIGGQTNIDSDVVQESIENLLVAGFLNLAETKRSASKVIARRKHGATKDEMDDSKSSASEAEAEADSSEAESSEAVADEDRATAIFDFDLCVELDKILSCCKEPDDGSRGVLMSLARKLPIGSVAKVRESCEKRRGVIGVGYAKNALQSEIAERGKAA